MSLQDKLDAFKADFEANKAPAAAVEAFHRSTRELIDNGNAERALKAGDRAPEFTLPDSDGNLVYSKTLLAKGPLALTFYRGVWCPYCNLDLQALEEIADDIRSRGASLLAISQQGASSSRKSQRTNNLSYPILTDQSGDLAEQFGLRWTLQPYVIEFFKMFQVDLPKIHNDDKWTLPMPARYVIDTDGTIAYAEVNPDYTRRPEPSDLFPVLDRIALTAAK
ncbi:MAG: peroxiredoxin-like family protein [Cyanobacteria bacterium P01_A01_bin.3]